MRVGYDELTECARAGCGHRLAVHELDDRFSHAAGACDFGMSVNEPEGTCVAECMGFVVPGALDELPAILAAQDAL